MSLNQNESHLKILFALAKDDYIRTVVSHLPLKGRLRKVVI